MNYCEHDYIPQPSLPFRSQRRKYHLWQRGISAAEYSFFVVADASVYYYSYHNHQSVMTIVAVSITWCPTTNVKLLCLCSADVNEWQTMWRHWRPRTGSTLTKGITCWLTCTKPLPETVIVDLSSVKFIKNRLMTISTGTSQPPINKFSLNITYFSRIELKSTSGQWIYIVNIIKSTNIEG